MYRARIYEKAARGGVTTAMDHYYVYPKGSGDLSGAIIRAARETDVRFTLAHGSMDCSEKDGGLPPDFAVETFEGALAATEATVKEHHDDSFDAMTQVAVAHKEDALNARQALRLGTYGGAQVLGRAARSARWSRASSPTWCCGGRTPSPTPPSPTRSPRWSWARRPR